MDTEIKEDKKQIQFCWRCGRILYINKKNGRIGCRNTKCLGYLPKSKYLDNDVLQTYKR